MFIGTNNNPVVGQRIWLSGDRHRIQLRCGNFYKSDISPADVVFVYATSSQTSHLLPLLECQLRPGARVVSIAADFPEWQPSLVDREMLIFLYEMPPARVVKPVQISNGVK